MRDAALRVTAKRVAKDLGVSEATVSLAVNNRPGVNPETRERILAHIDMLKSADSGKRNPDGVLVKILDFRGARAVYDEETASLFSVSYHEFFRVVKENGFDLKLVFAETVDELAQAVADSRTDGTTGILLCATDMSEREFEAIRGCELPLMVFDNEFNAMDYDSLVIDNIQDVILAMRFLRERGHRDIVYFNNTTKIHNFSERLETFQRLMREQAAADGVQDAKPFALEVGSRIEDIHERVKNWIAGAKKLPTAILCENYAISIGTLKALHDSGVRVPADISIIGIDELPPYILLDCKFTHVRIPHTRKANLAINRLIERIRTNPEEIVQIRVVSRVVEGESVRIVKEAPERN